jgi:hypothetical protein
MKDFIVAREYVHEASIGNEVVIDEAISSVEGFLSKNMKEKTIEGYRLLYINNLGKAERKLIKESFSEVTKNVYPFLYIAVQFFDKEGEESILSFIREKGFVEI